MFISNWKFPDCVHLFGAWARQAVIASCTNSRKELRRCCSPIGHNNTKHFLCPIRSQHSLDRLEMVRWESVPRGSSACAWKRSSRLFSRLDWLPLGLRGCSLNGTGTLYGDAVLKRVTEWVLSNEVEESANQIQTWMKLLSHSENWSSPTHPSHPTSPPTPCKSSNKTSESKVD